MAVHFRPRLTVYYDTDGDGTVDLVLAQKDGVSDVEERRLRAGRWETRDVAPRPLLDPEHLTGRAERERLARIIDRLRAEKR